MMKNLKLVEEPGQKVWAWIAVAFAAFYFGEAFLFWGPEPRVHAPAFTPLIYWGAFGACVIWLLRRRGRSQISGEPTPEIPHGLQTAILGTGITASVVGIAFLVIHVTGNVTLGHAVMLGAMFEAAIIIAGMSGNLGWLAASLVCAASAALVLIYPAVQDYTLGAAMAISFALVGLILWSVHAKAPLN